MPEEIIHQKHRLSSFQIIISGFVGVILLGALLLMLPVSTTEGCITPFNETLFTATSAVCVTGLVVQDTGSYWSGFGQAVILDTDRRTWRCNSCSIVRIAVRTKNLSDAAQHHAGRNFRSKGWRSCPADAVYPSRYIFN